MSELMRVYLAGKIRGADGWRDRFVRWLGDGDSQPWSTAIEWFEDCCGDNDRNDGWHVLGHHTVVIDSASPKWPIIPAGFLGIADYVGPYAISHGQDTGHGVVSNFGTEGLRGDGNGSEVDDKTEIEIVSRCLSAIDVADMVVAIVTADSPGLLCELGYALAHKRPIIALVRKGTEFDWFPRRLCNRVIDFFDDGPLFWTQAAEHLQKNLFSILTSEVEPQTYYQSRWWKNRRHSALLKAGGKCMFCASAKDLSVHHNTYANIYREPDCDLCVLCESCHKSADVRRRAQEKALVKV